MTAPNVDPEVHLAAAAELVNASRHRIRRAIPVNDRRSGLATGGSFLVVAAAWICIAPPETFPLGLFAACVAAHIAAGCVEFEIGPGCALPTMPVQVVMLFFLPLPLVPVAVLLGLLGSSHLARLWDPSRKERTMVLAASGWQVVGPAAVFAIVHVTHPAPSDWPVYALALTAQFTFDAATSWIRNCYGLGLPTGQLVTALKFTFLCDLTLAPVGFAAALALPASPGALLLVLPPTALLAVLQSDRRKHLDQTLALSAAFADTRNLARRDALTGVANRLAFEEASTRYRETDAPIGVILADVDGLKAANDDHGHALGDLLLIAIAELLSDVGYVYGIPVFRIGGDEFALLFPDTSRDLLEVASASVRAALIAAPSIGEGIRVSASVGIGRAATGSDLQHAIAEADRALNTEKVDRRVGRSTHAAYRPV